MLFFDDALIDNCRNNIPLLSGEQSVISGACAAAPPRAERCGAKPRRLRRGRQRGRLSFLPAETIFCQGCGAAAQSLALIKILFCGTRGNAASASSGAGKSRQAEHGKKGRSAAVFGSAALQKPPPAAIIEQQRRRICKPGAAADTEPRKGKQQRRGATHTKGLPHPQKGAFARF